MTKAVLISCFDWYEGRLKPIKEILESEGCDVTILTSDFDHLKKQYLKSKHVVCKYIHVPAYKKNISVQRIQSHLQFGKEVAKLLKEIKPDLIYVLIPPNNVLKHCAEYKKSNPNVKLIADIIDLWPESIPMGSFVNTFPAKVWKNLRDSNLQYADHVFTECNFYREKLAEVIQNCKSSSTLYLYKDQQTNIRKLIEKINSEYIPFRCRSDKIIKLAYLGSINNILDIDGICDVTKRIIAQQYKVEVHIVGQGESKQRFIERLKEAGASVAYYGAIFDEVEKIKILAHCDFGINMMKSTSQVGLTIKSIDYFSMGLPLINNIKGDTWEMVELNNIGYNVDSNCYINDIINLDKKKTRDFFCTQFSKEAYVLRVRNILKWWL